MNFDLRLLLILMAILCTLPAVSQEGILRGVVKADSLSDFRINVINSTQKTVTTTSENGAFEFEVRVNDTLIFSAIQYEPVEIIITNEVIDKGLLEVQMFDRINELEEVEIGNFNLTGNLQNDILGIGTYSKEDLGFAVSTAKQLTSIERKLHTAKSGKIDALLNFINGRTKMLKKAEENEDTQKSVESILTIFSTTFFVENLRIPENRVKGFIYFCMEDPYFRDLVSDSRRLEILQYFLKNAPDFVKNSSGHRRVQGAHFIATK